MSELTTNGVRLCFEDWGNGEGRRVLLLGGSAMPAGAWELSIGPALVTAGYRVVALEARGVGRSDSPPSPYAMADLSGDAAGVIEALGLGPCGVVGLSLGGFVAEDLAWRRPDLVAGAVLIASAGRTTAYARARLRAEHDVMAGLGVPPPSFDQLLVAEVALPFETLQDDDDAVQAWLDLMATGLGQSQTGRAGQLAAECDWLFDEDRYGRWPELTPPCRVVSFEHDLCFPPRRGREAAAAMAQGSFTEIAGLAHGNGPFEGARQLGEVVVEFLGTLDG